MIGRRGFITGLVAVVAAPAIIFLIGSAAGDHSLRYDRKGTWLCWTPHDRMSRQCMGLLPFVPVSRLDEIAPDKGGFIGCENGRPTIRNITIGNLNIPEGKFLIDTTAMVCNGEDI